ncbi:hypothetical protein [Alteraurantiacibacter aquimixticola]|uniref:Uncharacterized protein n=1 Tax=Alteraurantiacibacter aquimixticola TaxID=2489173 RepID=A0A4T3F861_9SPHN|nr:hypothetical protein [Alteraurantiacibacter aquimixticola]TIX51932.1 hypothetical protein E5222_05705 [Alteraurantiacibacter aquimixticola]
MTVLRIAFAAGKTVLALGSALALSGCFMTPGQFTATMDVRQSGAFSFAYDGEIFMLALSDLAEMAEASEMNKPCYDEGSFEERPCTQVELNERRSEQDEEAAMMQAFLGGMDLSDPEAAGEFAAKLERQTGWNSVTYLGNGLFDVDFAISSRLTHDFAFPTLEDMPTGNVFVSASLRDEDRVRIAAPGFAAQGGNPFQAMMMTGMAAASAEAGSAKGGKGSQAATMPDMPQMEGTFRIVTDATILANNTDEGPQPAAGGQLLEWQIEPGTTAAPTALLVIEH